MHIDILKICLTVLSIAAGCLFGFSAEAADISALNFNGNLIGKVIPDGTVINFDNEQIGHINADGFVFDENNILLGGIVPQGIAVSYNNSILGKVNNDGSVTSVNDSLIGKVLPNGLVVNDNYDILGAVVAPGLVFNDKGNIVGRVSGDGKFYDLAGEIAGFVTPDGYAYTVAESDRKTELAGKIISSKIVIDSAGKFLGSIAPDGKVMDLKKNVIGNVHANGFVYNQDNNIIGHIVEGGYAFDMNGQYMGVVSYNGNVILGGKEIASAVNGNRVVDKSGNITGFTVSSSSTANTLDGRYLGRVTENGYIAKGRDYVGKIGASGNVVDDKGTVIGRLNATGPVFDYLGQLRANAAVGGKVVSLEGVDLGTMKSDGAFDSNGKKIGQTLSSVLNFDNANNFIGMSGTGTVLEVGGKTYKISPYGYVFDENGNVSGRNFSQGGIYSPDGSLLSYTAGNGKTENSMLNEVARLTSSGLVLDKNNKKLGGVVSDNYITSFSGENIGFSNIINTVFDNRNQAVGKILPDNRLVSLTGGTLSGYGRAGDSSLSIGINGDYLGDNQIGGEVMNGGEVVGKISSSGDVLDNMGALYGSTLPFGAIISPECKFLGVVSDRGDARTVKDAYLGMLLGNGQVINETEQVIGYVVRSEAANGKGGNSIGVVNPLGSLINYNNQNLGCLDIRGKIRNSQKEIIGQVIPQIPVMGFDNKIIGQTNFQGNVVDNAGVQIAVIDIDDAVLSKSGKNIGVPFKYKVAFDRNNIYLGRVSPDGNVVSDAGEILGTVDYNGEVKTKTGQSGYALYGLYVYDNDDKTVGYIAKNGRAYSIMGELIGVTHNGFVLDKKQNLIARAARDYEIRNAEKNVLGHLSLNGTVTDIRNVEVGTLQQNGDVVDANGKVIATAEKLQYYQKEEVIPAKNAEASSSEIQQKDEVLTQKQSEDDKQSNIIENNNTVESVSDEMPVKKESMENHSALTEPEEEGAESDSYYARGKVIGIAITPGGKYIGDVTEDGRVWDENGKEVGKLGENGEIQDKDGNIVGAFQESSPAKKEINTQWWKQIATGATINPYSSGNAVTNVGPGGGIGPGERYNPRRAAILSQLQDDRRRTMSAAKIMPGYNVASYTGWQDNWGDSIPTSVSSLRVNMDNMITADKPIPAVLARSLISLGSAPVTAIVERNVYGDSGRNVIIPAGSRVIGGLQNLDSQQRFDNTSGGVKLEISWSRIIRPDGIAFFLDNVSQTGDAQGRGGGALGYVDEQLVKKYTLPLVGTLATSAITYMMAADEDATGDVETSKQQAASDARQNFMDKMDEILEEIIENKKQIQSVTYIPAGTRIIIYPMRDLWLKSTKEIENGIDTPDRQNSAPPLIDEDAERSGTQSAADNNNNTNNGQKVVLGNQAQQQNGNNNSTPLISDTSQNNQTSAKGTGGTGALPPPAADGTVSDFPENEEDLSGEIELF